MSDASPAARLVSMRIAELPDTRYGWRSRTTEVRCVMHGSKHELAVAFQGDGVDIREAEWDAINVALESFPPGLDTAPLFRGLPDDRCQCPHWGYAVRGRFRVIYQDHEETIVTGDAYYLAPGHTAVFEEPTELVEFSPAGEYQKTVEVAARNVAAMQGAVAD